MTTDPAEQLKAQLNAFRLERSSLEASMGRVSDFARSETAQHTLPAIDARLGLLENTFMRAVHVQNQLNILDAAEMQSNRIMTLEGSYLDTKTSLLTIRQHLVALSTPTSPHPPGGDRTLAGATSGGIEGSSKRLPKIKLRHFDGSAAQWLTFKSSFESNIVKNKSLSDVDRFEYLCDSLKGSAKGAIKSLELLDSNFDKAWELLNNRYFKPRLIFEAHVREILNLPEIKRATTDQIREIVNIVEGNITALETLLKDTSDRSATSMNFSILTGEAKAESWKSIAEGLLMGIVCSKIDAQSRSKWEERAEINKIPTWDKLKNFLEERATIVGSRDAKPASEPNNSRSENRKTALVASKSPQITSKCRFCSESGHSIYKCLTFLDLSAQERVSKVKELNLCNLCLSKGHKLSDCPSLVPCLYCKKRHNYLLHISENRLNSDDKASETSSSSNSCNLASLSARDSGKGSDLDRYVFLATAEVLVRARNGRFEKARVLLDSASQLELMTDSFAKKLGLKFDYCNLIINGIGGSEVSTRKKLRISLKSANNDFTLENVSFFILPQLTESQPSNDIHSQRLFDAIPANVSLADPLFFKAQPVDMVLGASTFFDLIAIGHIKLGEGLPCLQKTLFGWVVVGPIDHPNDSALALMVTQESQGSENQQLDEAFDRFWRTEEISQSPNNSRWTLEESECEAHFVEHCRVHPSGKYQVRIPFKCDLDALGDSYSVAIKSFLRIESRLKDRPEIYNQYRNFLSEYESLDHMRLIPESELSRVRYFIPHHCVLKPSSSTTKCRVVFNASQITESGISLNDLQKIGPTIQSDLFDILLRFCMHRYVLGGDIAKMYRQVLVADDDTWCQAILWRPNDRQPIRAYRLMTVTYGTASGSWLAIRALQQAGIDAKDHFPLAHDRMTDFYVDNLLTGDDDLNQLIEIRRQIVLALGPERFPIRKWCANDDRIVSDIPASDREPLIRIGDSEVTKALGVSWQPESDQFEFYFDPSRFSKKCTKRIVSSEICSFFDPLGYLQPIIVAAKIFLHDLWQLKLDWDESLPLGYHSQWMRMREDLVTIGRINFPRHVRPKGKVIRSQLIGFSDASTKAYGCAVYLRSIDSENKVFLSLVGAKSRVAPQKTISLPRLELNAALLLVQLMEKIRAALSIPIHDQHCFSDSEIVLHWLNAHPSSWAAYVANRVTKIQELSTDCLWHHVSSGDNPANLVSRGIRPTKMVENSLFEFWTKGPEFLRSDSSEWPEFRPQATIESTLEYRRPKNVLATTAVAQADDMIARFKFHNSFIRTRRCFARVHRFIENCRRSVRKEPLLSGELSPDDLNAGLELIARHLQHLHYPSEIEILSKGGTLSAKSILQKLQPFFDKNTLLIHVGGRLDLSNLPYNKRHQMLLPREHPFTTTIARHLHVENCHAGPQSLLAIIREQFWIVRGRDVARKVFQNCYNSTRYRPRLFEQRIGQLPVERISPSRPFRNCGVDFCGPFWIHIHLRGKRPYKAYICLFVCLATKAIHLELVSDLSTDTFVAALTRFAARRDTPDKIFCDNALNFVGARNRAEELKALKSLKNQAEIVRACANKGLSFHFIPPRSPNFGGIWESAIKNAKNHLYRTILTAELDYEEMTTLLCRIEAIINSRPITGLSDDPNDLEPLTPAHFLVGKRLTALPELPDTGGGSIRQRWRALQARTQEFWSRWTREYLSRLQESSKWLKESPNVSLGQLVLIHEDNTPPMKWSIGRIVKVFHGPDGKVRVAEVKTASSLLKRSVRKLAPLPSGDKESDLGNISISEAPEPCQETIEDSDEAGPSGQPTPTTRHQAPTSPVHQAPPSPRNQAPPSLNSPTPALSSGSSSSRSQAQSSSSHPSATSPSSSSSSINKSVPTGSQDLQPEASRQDVASQSNASAVPESVPPQETSRESAPKPSSRTSGQDSALQFRPNQRRPFPPRRTGTRRPPPRKAKEIVLGRMKGQP